MPHSYSVQQGAMGAVCLPMIRGSMCSNSCAQVQVQPTYDVPGTSPGSKHAQNACATAHIKHPGIVQQAWVALQCIAIGLSPHLQGSRWSSALHAAPASCFAGLHCPSKQPQ